VAWCERIDALDLPNATKEEQEELFLILKQLRVAVIKVFQPDWFNYSFLGNETCHIHAHFVPCYATPRNFEDIMFTDKLFGHNWKTDHDFVVPESILNKIKLVISDALK